MNCRKVLQDCGIVYRYVVLLIVFSNIVSAFDLKPFNSNLKSGSQTCPDAITSYNQNKIKHSLIYVLTSSISFPTIAYARARGAFELDVEYYVNSLLGNDPNKQLKRKALRPSPRVLDKNFCNDLINIICHCITIVNGTIDESYIKSKSDALIPNFLPYFKEFAPIARNDVTDQYFFDIYLYSLYLVAAETIPTSVERVRLRNLVGEATLKKLIMENKPLFNDNVKGTTTIDLAKGIKLISDLFKNYGIISGYEFNDEDLIDQIYCRNTFEQVLLLSIFRVQIIIVVRTRIHIFHLHSIN
jgi:hypothetical protein